MTELADTIILKTAELEAELKFVALWQNEMPAWVHGYNDDTEFTKPGFIQWLQFVFIPNHSQKIKIKQAVEKKLMVPYAIKYFGADVNKGKLLQILIELDALL